MNIQEIAKKRIDILLNEAKLVIDDNLERSRRYVKLAWKIATKHTIRLGKKRRLICSKCFTLQIPGKTTRIRLEKNKRLVYTCKNCGKRKVYIYRMSS